MRTMQFAGVSLAALSLLAIAACAPPPGYQPNPANIPGAAPPSLSGPQGWQYNPTASNYAPNSSTGYAPYSQDMMNDVIHDGSSSRN
jgi:hypothetical protein